MAETDIKIRLDLDADGYTVSAKSVANSLRQLDGEFKKFDPSVRQVEQRIRSTSNKFRDLVMVAGTMRFAMLNLYDVFGRLPMAIMKNAGELERMQTLMTGLSKETDRAAKAMDGIKDFNFVVGMAKNAPFEISALSDSFVKLKVAGIDPTNGSLKTLVDSVARFGGNSDVLKRASVAISQMAGKGVVSMEELRQQLGEAIPTAMQAMADGMGVSMAKLTKVVSTGTLAAGPAIQAMLRQLDVENAGAASKMMDTWVGMQAQLKTEWMLTSKAISDAGFGDAMKGAVQQIIEMLRDPAFKSFAVDFGQGLASAVKSLVSMAGFMREHADLIKIAAAAWLAYKVQTSLVAGGLSTLREQMGKVSEVTAKDSAAVTANYDLKRARIQDQINAQRQEVESFKSASVQRVTELTKENASIQALNAQRVASYQAMAARIAEFDAREANARSRIDSGTASNRDYKNFGKITSQVGEINKMRDAMHQLNDVIKSNESQVRMNNAAMQDHARSIVANTGDLTKNEAALQRSINQLRFHEGAAKAATFATRGFGAVLNALGGWVGVGITALIVLIAYWNKVSNAANEAAAAQARAAQGASTKDDLKKLEDRRRSLQLQVDELEKTTTGNDLSTSFGHIPVSKSPEQLKKDLDKAKELRRQLEENDSAIRRAQQNISRADASVFADGMMNDSRKTLEAIARIGSEERDGYERELVKNTQSLKKGSDKEAEERKKWNDKKQESRKKELQQTEAFWAAQQSQFEKQLATAKGQDKENLQRAIDQAREQKQATQSQLEAYNNPQAIYRTDGKDPFADPEKKAKRAPKTPFADMAAAIEADRKKLDEELANLNATGEKGASVADKIALLWDKFNRGKLEKGTTKSMVEELVKKIESNAKVEEEIKKAQKAAQGIENVTRYIEGMQPELEDAIASIADPMGTSMKGRERLNQADRFLRQHVDAIAAYAKKEARSVEDVKTEILSNASRVDMAKQMVELANSTRTMEDSVLSTTREATAQRMRLADEAHARKMEQLFTEYAATTKNESDIRAFRASIDANNAARSAKTAYETRTPLMKLAEEWGNLSNNLEQSTANWTNSAVDAFTNLATTGKSSFRDMTVSILKDLARLYAQKGFSMLLQMGISSVGGLFGSSSAASSGGANYSLGSGNSGLGLKLNGASFANGGIMTEFGSLPLRKYANGGVANSPQLALYGEGKRPEAYVPLPDGRTIPVTMEGAGGAGQVNNVNISIVVNSDGSESSDGGGDVSSLFGSMAQRIKGVVREELLTQRRQGGLMT